MIWWPALGTGVRAGLAAACGLAMPLAAGGAAGQNGGRLERGPAALERFAPLIGGVWHGNGEVPGAGSYTAERSYTWSLDSSFVRVTQVMRFETGPTIEEQMMIGWDPVDQRIHVWSFASDGSYSDGYEVPGEDPRRWTAEGRTVGGRGGEWRITTFVYDPDAMSVLVEVRNGREYQSALTMAFTRER